MLGLWFLLQAVAGAAEVATPVSGGEGGGVAYFAHIGGFVFGLPTPEFFASSKRLKRQTSPVARS